MNQQAPSLWMPALIGGGVFGFLGSLPIAACACCAWMIGAGLLATFLYSKQCRSTGTEFRAGGG
ncbi:MAG: hypothetical protein R3344_13790, partial [Acidobacteriota bacterium]|nr:hypothetical protein [Acidobacteriota bacterium]